jgi:hypothetical protein
VTPIVPPIRSEVEPREAPVRSDIERDELAPVVAVELPEVFEHDALVAFDRSERDARAHGDRV